MGLQKKQLANSLVVGAAACSMKTALNVKGQEKDEDKANRKGSSVHLVLLSGTILPLVSASIDEQTENIGMKGTFYPPRQ